MSDDIKDSVTALSNASILTRLQWFARAVIDGSFAGVEVSSDDIQVWALQAGLVDRNVVSDYDVAALERGEGALVNVADAEHLSAGDDWLGFSPDIVPGAVRWWEFADLDGNPEADAEAPPKCEAFIFWSDDDMGYVAVAPDLPGCVAVGSTRDEAAYQLDLAMTSWVTACRSAGNAVPEPTTRMRDMEAALAVPPLSFKASDLKAFLDALLTEARGLRDGVNFGAVNWADLRVVSIESCRPLLDTEDGAYVSVMIEEASPDSDLRRWLQDRLAADGRFPDVYITLEW